MDEASRDEDDEFASVAVQTMISLNVNYNQPLNPYDVVGISVYRELQRRRTLAVLEQAMTLDLLMDLISERILTNTRNILHNLDVDVDEEMVNLLFENGGNLLLPPPPMEKPPLIEIEETQPCSICLDGITKGCSVYDIPCKHHFHSDCLTQWLERQKNSCPLCRQKMVQ